MLDDANIPPPFSPFGVHFLHRIHRPRLPPKRREERQRREREREREREKNNGTRISIRFGRGPIRFDPTAIASYQCRRITIVFIPQPQPSVIIVAPSVHMPALRDTTTVFKSQRNAHHPLLHQTASDQIRRQLPFLLKPDLPEKEHQGVWSAMVVWCVSWCVPKQQ